MPPNNESNSENAQVIGRAGPDTGAPQRQEVQVVMHTPPERSHTDTPSTSSRATTIASYLCIVGVVGAAVFSAARAFETQYGKGGAEGPGPS